MLIRIVIALIFLASFSGPANAAIAFSGYFNDSGNAALVGSVLGPASFGDDYEIANNVALYSLSVPIAGPASFESKGFAAGGADPYFTLFQGSGDTATFFGSNYDQAFSTGGDFILPFTLAAGDYMVAMGVFANMSYAENSGSGTLGDGFAGIGEPDYVGNYYYELEVTLPTSSVPEPCAILLIGASFIGFGAIRRKMA